MLFKMNCLKLRSASFLFLFQNVILGITTVSPVKCSKPLSLIYIQAEAFLK